MARTILRLNPAGLPDASGLGYAQITVAQPGALAFVSGQVALSAHGEPTPPTLTGQTEMVISNLKAALGSLGATPSDILQMRIYVLDLDDEALGIIMGQITAFLNGALPALTGVAVAALAAPDLLIETEMTVQMPGQPAA